MPAAPMTVLYDAGSVNNGVSKSYYMCSASIAVCAVVAHYNQHGGSDARHGSSIAKTWHLENSINSNGMYVRNAITTVMVVNSIA